MTPSEINQLRKSGRLQEALAGAEKLILRTQDRYAVGALFWCLNELYKQQEGNEKTATVSRMKELYLNYCEGDRLMREKLEIAELSLIPHCKDVKEALRQAKDGEDAIALHQKIFDLHSRGEIDSKLFPDLGWLTYYVLKATDLNNALGRKRLLNEYLHLNLERPSLLHSLILDEAIKIERNTPLQFRIRDFIRFWGLNNLREEDWELYRTPDGNTLPSKVEKLIGVYAKELKTDAVEAPDEFAELVDKALERYPQSQNMPYFKAIVLLSKGQREEALNYYRDLILRFPSKAYLWEHTSKLIDDIDTKIALLCKAITIEDNEEFLVKIRLKMAELLIKKNLIPNAKYELEKYRQTCQTNGWHLKPEFHQINSQIANVTSVSDNRGLYSQYALQSDEFIYSSIPAATAVKVADRQLEDRNHPGRRFTQWTLRLADSTVQLRKPNKFGLNRRASNGTIYSVRIHNGKIVWIKPLDSIPTESWLKVVEGEVSPRIDRNGRQYARINNVYIGASLLSNLPESQVIKVLALRNSDGRWQAISRL